MAIGKIKDYVERENLGRYTKQSEEKVDTDTR
jgi:hypothetical protein